MSTFLCYMVKCKKVRTDLYKRQKQRLFYHLSNERQNQHRRCQKPRCVSVIWGNVEKNIIYTFFFFLLLRLYLRPEGGTTIWCCCQRRKMTLWAGRRPQTGGEHIITRGTDCAHLSDYPAGRIIKPCIRLRNRSRERLRFPCSHRHSWRN